MSRHNKVNPDHYTLAGRLSPDDLARERRKQSESNMGRGRARARKAMPPWLVQEQGGEAAAHDKGDTDNSPAAAQTNASQDADGQEATAGQQDEQQTSLPDNAAQQPKGKPRRTAVGKTGASKSAKATGRKDRAGTSTGSRSSAAVSRAKPKASGASGTPRSGKAPKARGTAARGASQERARRSGARKTASASTKKKTAKKGTQSASKKSVTTQGRKSAAGKKGTSKRR